MRRLTLAVLLAGFFADVHAQEPEAPTLSFSGFGTVGLVHSSEKRADFSSNTFKPDGAGYTHHWSPDVDTVIGGQLTAKLAPGLSAVLQVVSEQNYDRTYRPHVEWANVKYQFDPDLSVRVGRIALPLGLVTDSRKIGYVNPWVRPPEEAYNLISLTNNDGVDGSYRFRIGSTTQTIQAIAGRSTSRYPSFGNSGVQTAKVRHLISFADTFERGPTTVRLSYARARLTIPELSPLFDAFRRFGPQGEALADKYQIKDALITLMGIGASYDPGPWFLMGEVVHLDTHSAFGTNTAWYATSGYRIDRFTPYVTYARVHADRNSSDPGLSVSGLPPQVASSAVALNAALDGLLGREVNQDTISVGVRWDFAKGAALKVQVDHTRLGAGSAGVLTNTQPDFRPGGSFSIFSTTVSFVF